MVRRRSAVLLYSTLVVASCYARSLYAQEVLRWAVRAEVARSWMHENDEGSAVALHFAGRVGRPGYVRLEGGLLAGSGFGGFDAGIELDFFPQSRATVFVGGGFGIVGEEDFGGGFARANGGVAVRFATRYAARVSGQTAVHDGQRGPNLVSVGIEVRFGRRR